MGQFKKLYEQINEVQAKQVGTLAPKVHILMCNGKAVHAYVDHNTAEYEMYLCQHGDAIELGENNSYEIVTLDLATHRLD